MDIIFDDSFKFLSNFQKHEDEIPTRISSLGSVMIEKNIRLAVDSRVQGEWNKYKAATPADRTIILTGVMTNSTYADTDKEWFQTRIQSLGGGGSSGGWTKENDDVQGTAISESDIVGEAGVDVGSVIKLKEAVLARLRMRGINDQKINDILVLFMEKIMLPFSETIKILDYLLEESLKARVDPVDMIEFWAYHYQEKRSQGLTKSIIDQAVKLQEINPSINIFHLLKNAAIGNQAEVGKVILIKDPDARLVVNNLIALSQSALPEQAEQVRRNFQFSRDALNNYQEKLRIQKALFDMMKTEEMNRNLSSFIADTSFIFKMLLTQPLFRAIRDVFYDLQASKILLNTYSSLVTDTQPLTPRITPREEQQTPGEAMYQSPNNQQRISSRFVPLKKNNIVEAQAAVTLGPGAPSAITNPGTASQTASQTTLQSAPNAITGQQSLSGVNATPQTQGSLGYASSPDPVVLVGFMEQVRKKIADAFKSVAPVFKFVLDFLIQGIDTIMSQIRSGASNIIQTVVDTFLEIVKNITQYFTNSWDSIKKSVEDFMSKGSGDVPATLSFTNEKFLKLAQGTPQTSTTGYNSQKWAAGIGTVIVALVAALGVKNLGPAIKAAFKGLKSLNNISEIVNLFLPAVEAVKNFIIEVIYEINPNAGNKAPVSPMYYDSRGRFTAEGARRLYNLQQTRVSLGISDKENLALSRAEKQRSENIATVRTQLEILQRSMDQPVYLGGKSDVAPADVPKDLQDKINVFLKFCKSVQDACQAEYLILKKAIDRVSASFDPMQKIQAQNLLSNVRNDISWLQSTIAEYSSSAVVLENIQRKRKLQMVLGPTLKKMQALESLGISKAALITGKNGVLAQLARIRHEEALALQKLRKEYQEKMQLLENPDIAQKEFAFPVDTRATRLPLPPLPPTAPTSV